MSFRVYFTAAVAAALLLAPIADGDDGGINDMNDNAIFTNHLAGSTSPYLLQHLHNPVDWYPWGEEAFEKAKREDKPVFLSIGYSTCHWCHVMAHHCFENEEIATYLNQHFVSVKVDREERPDLDAYYMAAVQAMNDGRGGWPMTIFLTPDKEVIFAGTTYLEDTFPRLLGAIVDGWENRRDEITSSAAEITRAIDSNRDMELSGSYGGDVIAAFAAEKKSYFDEEWGGWRGAPKFPDAMGIMLMLRYYEQTSDEETLKQVELTLRKMAMGGVYDQVGGGFHRYSTDERWFLPHFEKMLYDNALLAIALLETARLSGDDFYRYVAEDTLRFIEREMLLKNGGFACAFDADSEGVEGKFYMWETAELERVLGKPDVELITAVWNLKSEGNYTPESILEAEFAPGQNVPWRDRPWNELARETDIGEDELIGRVDTIRDKLYEHRAKRVWPLQDDKQLVSWNALAIMAFARAYVYTGDDHYLEIAETAFYSIYDGMIIDGELYHTRRGDTVHVRGMLEDYAGLLKAAIDLYRVTGDGKYLKTANTLAGDAIEKFYDEEESGFYNVVADTPDAFTRSKPIYDGVQPSGNSLMAVALLQLGYYTENDTYTEIGEKTLAAFGRLIAEQPASVAYLLNAADIAENGFTSIEVVGDGSDPKTSELLYAARELSVGERILLSRRGNTPDDADEPPRAYVCKGIVCYPPVYEVAELKGLAK